MTTTVITVRGTGELRGAAANMLTRVTGKLDLDRFETGPRLDLDYPAQIGPFGAAGLLGPSEETSRTAGVAALAAAVRATPNRAGVIGYSLGSCVVTAFLEAKARGEYADCEIAWAALVANPWRAQGWSIDRDRYGFGINGARGRWPTDIPIWEVANPADVITSCPPDSPLRSLADGITAFTAVAGCEWGSDLIDRMLRRRWQPRGGVDLLHPVQTWRRYARAADDLNGYLFGQHHFQAYIDGGYLDRLAARINATR